MASDKLKKLRQELDNTNSRGTSSGNASSSNRNSQTSSSQRDKRSYGSSSKLQSVRAELDSTPSRFQSRGVPKKTENEISKANKLMTEIGDYLSGTTYTSHDSSVRKTQSYKQRIKQSKADLDKIIEGFGNKFSQEYKDALQSMRDSLDKAEGELGKKSAAMKNFGSKKEYDDYMYDLGMADKYKDYSYDNIKNRIRNLDKTAKGPSETASAINKAKNVITDKDDPIGNLAEFFMPGLNRDRINATAQNIINTFEPTLTDEDRYGNDDYREMQWLKSHQNYFRTTDDIKKELDAVKNTLENKYGITFTNDLSSSAVQDEDHPNYNKPSYDLAKPRTTNSTYKIGSDEEVNRLKDRYDELQQALYMADKKDTYTAMPQAQDFEENSQYKPVVSGDPLGTLFASAKNEGDYEYRLINDPEFAKSEQARIDLTAAKGGVDNSANIIYRLSQITDEEKATYNYIYNTQGGEAAKEYLDDYLMYSLNERRYQQQVEEARQFAQENPVGASLVSIPKNFGSVAGYVEAAGQGLSNMATGENRPVDWNGPLMAGTYGESSTIRDTVGNDVIGGGPGSFFYQTVMSMGDSVMSMPFGAWVGAGILGGAAATAASKQAKDAGASDSQALTIGILEGAAETVFEHFSLENLKFMSVNDRATTISQALKNMFKQGVTEGSEEMFTTIANTISEEITLADLSTYNQTKQRYIEQGYSEEEAERLASMDWWSQLGQDTLGGVVSGFGFGFGANFVANNSAISQEGRNVIKKESGDALIKSTLENITDTSSRAYQLAQMMSEDPSKQTQRNLGKLAVEVENYANKGEAQKAEASKVRETMSSANVMDRMVQGIRDERAAQTQALTQQNNEATLEQTSTRAANIEAGKEQAVEVPKQKIATNKTAQANAEKTHDMTVTRDGKQEQVNSRIQVTNTDKYASPFNSAEDGSVTIKLDNGTEVNTDEVQFADKNTQEIMKAAKRFAAQGWTADQVQSFIDNYDGKMDPNAYASAFGYAALRASSDMTGDKLSSEIISTLASVLNGDQTRAAYTVGLQMHDQAVADMAAEKKAAIKKVAKQVSKDINNSTAVANAEQEMINKKVKGSKGIREPGFVYEGEVTDKNRDTIDALRQVSKALGINIVVVDKLTGKVKLKDANGKNILKDGKPVYKEVAGNGKYSRIEGTVYISLDADRPLRVVLAHELTHFIQQYSPKLYEELKSYIREYMNRDGSNAFEDQVNTYIEEYGYKESVAIDEVVADACDMFLDASRFKQEMANELASKNRKLAEKIRDFIEKLLKSLNAFFTDQSGRFTQSKTSAILADTVSQKDLNKLRKMWDVALSSATKAYSKVSDKEIAAIHKEAQSQVGKSTPLNPNEYFSVQPRGASNAPGQGQDVQDFIDNLKPEERKVYDLFNAVNEASKVGDLHIAAVALQKGAIDWNIMLDSDPEWAAAAKRIAAVIPEGIRKDMRMDENGRLEETPFEKTFKLHTSLAQRLVDNLPKEIIDRNYEVDGKKVKLVTAGANQAVGGEAYRRALVRFTRDLYKRGLLKQSALSKLAKDDWGTLGFLTPSEKTIATGDFTTLCPQVYFNKGCFYCYRRAQLEAGFDNKQAGQSIWYTGDILRLTDKMINKLNLTGGLRVQSSGDWMPHFSTQLADLICDAEMRGLQVKIVTKEPSLIEYIASLKAQGLGKNIFLNISADYVVEEEGESNSEFLGMNADRPYRTDESGKRWWKRALSVEEANKFREKYDWVAIRIVAMNEEQFFRALKDPRIDVVTAFHGSMKESPKYIDTVKGEFVSDVDPIGNAGMPVFERDKNGNWYLTDKWDRIMPSGKVEEKPSAKTDVQKRVAQRLLDEGLVETYHHKTCCIYGHCDQCQVLCGKANNTFENKNATNRNPESIEYWESYMDKMDADAAYDYMQGEALVDQAQFSLKEPVERKGNLVAAHNMTIDQLLQTIKLGGMPMPSIAIFNRDYGHTRYGDVSLVFGLDTIDPSKSSKNVVYGGDAWTPTFPSVDLKVDSNVARRLSDLYYRVHDKFGSAIAKPFYELGVVPDEWARRNMGMYDGTYGEYFDKYVIDSLAKKDGMMRFYLAATKGVEVTNDAEAAKLIDQDEYRKWLRDQVEGIVEKRGIYNGTDPFTPSGNRRSFEAMHWEYTLENIVKAMRKEASEGGGGFATIFHKLGIWGVSQKQYKSLAEVRADADRLGVMADDDYNNLKQAFGERFDEIVESLFDGEGLSLYDRLTQRDDIADTIIEAVRKYKSKEAILNAIKKWYPKATMKTVNDTLSLMAEIANMPTEYFEAKPQRAVGLDEVKAVIIPDNHTDDTVQQLRDAGLNVIEYKAGDEQARIDALNSIEDEDVFFSLKETDDAYMAAVNKGDMETAQRMVDEAARRAGLNTPIIYHGTPKFGFTRFNLNQNWPFIYASSKAEVSAHYAGDNNYAFRRPIGKRYKEGNSVSDIIENAKWVLGRDLRVLSQKEKQEIYNTTKAEVSKIADKIDQLYAKFQNEDESFANAVAWVADLFFSVRDNDEEYNYNFNKDDGYRAQAIESLRESLDRFSENITKVKDYFNEHFEELTDSQKKFLQYLIGYEVGDAAIDIDSRMLRVATENALLTDVDNSGRYVYDALSLKEEMDKTKNIGTYSLYGDLGERPLEINAMNDNGTGSGFWAIYVPEMGGSYSTDAIAKWAKKNGYTSVIIRNVYDYGDLADDYIFFNENQVKSADPVTYDDNDNIIPLSQRFNEEEDDIRYSLKDEPSMTRYKSTAILKESTLDHYLKAFAADNPDYAQAYIVYMSPEAFLELTSTSMFREQLEQDTKPLDAEEFARTTSDVPIFLDIKDERDSKLFAYATVSGHEGRHRMIALRNAGIKSVPVAIFNYDTKYSKKKKFGITLKRQFFPSVYRHLSDTAYERAREHQPEVTITGKVIPLSTGNREELIREFTREREPNIDEVSLQYSLKDTDSMSNREILAGAFDVIAQTDKEKEVLERYRESVATLDKIQAQLDADRKEIHDIMFTKGGRAQKGERLAELQQKVKKAEADLNRWDSKLIRLQASKPIRDIVTRARANEARQTAAKYRERIAGVRDSNAVKDVKRKLQKLYNDLKKRALHPTEGKYIPAPLMETMLSVLEAIDYRGGREDTKIHAKLNDMYRQYEKLKNDNDVLNKSAYDEELSKMLDELVEAVGDKYVRDMSRQEITEVYRILRAISYTLNQKVKQIGRATAISVYEAGERAISEIDNAKGPLSRVTHVYNMGALSPMRFFRMISGWARDSVLQDQARQLNEGQRKMNEILMQGYGLFQEFLATRADQREFEAFHGKGKANWIQLKDASGKAMLDEKGKEVYITHDMLVALYLHSLNEDNLRHVISGGIRIPDLNAYVKGKGNSAYTKGDYHQKVMLTEDMLQKLFKEELTTYDMKYAQVVYDFFNTFSKQVINETSMALNGYKKAEVDNYFPIHVDDKFLGAQFDSIIMDGSLEGMGILKQRVKSSKPIYLEGASDAVIRNLNSVAKYGGLAIPIKNFTRIYNVNTVRTNEAGEVIETDADSVMNALSRKYKGDDALKYIEMMLKDLQQTREIREGGFVGAANRFLTQARGKFAQATLAMNLSVTLKQAASYPTAAAELGWAPLAKALMSTEKMDLDTLAKFTPIMWIRSHGYVDTELGDAMSNQDWSSKVPGLMGWIQKMDIATVTKLAKATEFYIRQMRPELKVGSDDYWRAVADKFNDVVEKTQPNYTAMQRPEILRTQNAIIRAMTMFMTQRLQNYNILFDAFGEYRAAKDSGDTAWQKAAGRNMRRAVTSQAVAAAVIAAMTMAVSMLTHRMKRYRDDDDEITAESFMGAFFGDMISTVAGSFLGGSEVYEIINNFANGTTYDVLDAPNITMVNDVIAAFEEFGKIATDIDKKRKEAEENGELYEGDADAEKLLWQLKEVGTTIAKFMGVPVDNAWKLGEGVYYYALDAANGTLWESDIDRSKTDYYNQMVKAIQEGDMDRYNKLHDKAMELVMQDSKYEGENAKTDAENTIQKGIKMVLAKNDERVRQAAEAMLASDTTTAGNLRKEMIAEGYSESAVVGAINYMIGQIKDDDETPVDDTVEDWEPKVYTSADIQRAYENGSQEALDDIKDYFMEQGLTEAEAQKKVDDEARKVIRPSLYDAIESGDITNAKRFIADLKRFGQEDEWAIVTMLSKKYKSIWQEYYMRGDTASMKALENALYGLELHNKEGNRHYTQGTFDAWKKDYQKGKK